MVTENNIPIKNIYYMLCYAWDVMHYIDDNVCGNERYDNIENLLARILVKEVGRLVRRGFYRSYIENTEELSKIKGSIDITNSINNLSFHKHKMVCVYDEYSDNVLFNQIIKSTLVNLLKNCSLAKKLKIEVRNIVPYFNDVELIEITKRHFYSLRFTRNNLNYRIIINVCRLLLLGMIANEDETIGSIADFYEEKRMNKLYEIFILNFYKRNLELKKYHVHAPKIDWQLDNGYSRWEDKFVVENELTNRRTDIVIENKIDNIQLIIDAKFYQNMLVQKYNNPNELTYRIGHLNQVRGYVLDSKFNGEKIGALLYPTVYYDKDYEQGKVCPINGSHIIVKCIDLSKDWEDIKNDLLSFAYKVVN